MNRKSLALSLIVCGMIVAGSIKTAQAEVIFNDRLPFSFSFFNECTGEWVRVSGSFHRVVSRVVEKDGTVKVHNNLTAHGTGIGVLSGLKYVWNDGIRIKVEDPVGPEIDRRQDQKLRLISKGGAPNEHLNATIEFVRDEDGVVTSVNISDVVCRG